MLKIENTIKNTHEPLVCEYIGNITSGKLEVVCNTIRLYNASGKF